MKGFPLDLDGGVYQVNNLKETQRTFAQLNETFWFLIDVLITPIRHSSRTLPHFA
jgi:hypothetical protein